MVPNIHSDLIPTVEKTRKKLEKTREKLKKVARPADSVIDAVRPSLRYYQFIFRTDVRV